jgi:hypothetical protein
VRIRLVENWFTSLDSRKTISSGTYLEKLIPRQFPSEAEFVDAVALAADIEQAANISFVTQLVVTIFLQVSFQMLWGLIDLMQILAFF